MSVLALFVQHILEQHTSILQNEMERDLGFFFFFSPDCDLGRSSSICHPNHCNLWFIFVYVLNSAFNNCSRHMDKRGWSIFIIHRAHVHTPPDLLTPEIVTDLHGTPWVSYLISPTHRINPNQIILTVMSEINAIIHLIKQFLCVCVCDKCKHQKEYLLADISMNRQLK